MRGNSSILRTETDVQYNSTPQTNVAPVDVVSAVLAIAFPLVLLGAIAAYRKRKAIVLQQRIRRLNRLWQRDTSERLF